MFLSYGYHANRVFHASLSVPMYISFVLRPSVSSSFLMQQPVSSPRLLFSTIQSSLHAFLVRSPSRTVSSVTTSSCLATNRDIPAEPQTNATILTPSFRNSLFSPEIVPADHSISASTSSKELIDSITNLLTPGKTSS